jgi:hypothetical protein
MKEEQDAGREREEEEKNNSSNSNVSVVVVAIISNKLVLRLYIRTIVLTLML